jgi:hypothetical protein
MGISLFGHSGRGSCDASCAPTVDPDPCKFRVLNGWDYPEAGACVLVVQYIGCTNYEGRKCLVCKGKTADYVNARELDPHFREGGPVIARFAPTVEGNRQARSFCRDAAALKEAYERGRADAHAHLRKVLDL